MRSLRTFLAAIAVAAALCIASAADASPTKLKVYNNASLLAATPVIPPSPAPPFVLFQIQDSHGQIITMISYDDASNAVILSTPIGGTLDIIDICKDDTLPASPTHHGYVDGQPYLEGAHPGNTF